MRQLRIGDLMEFEISEGTAYLQLVFVDEDRIELIRVLRCISQECYDDFQDFVDEPELFMVHFPLSAAYRKGIVKLVGNFRLPDGFKRPQFMRTEHSVQGGLSGWHIVNLNSLKREFTKNLSAAQKKLSPYGIWNDTLLKERLESGWDLSNWSNS